MLAYREHSNPCCWAFRGLVTFVPWVPWAPSGNISALLIGIGLLGFIVQ